MKLAFAILDVFTSTRYTGNPLAIVLVKRSPSSFDSLILAQDQKQAIAKEFNLSGTVFLYSSDDISTTLDSSVEIEIFTPSCELPFVGHSVIGVAWFMQHCMPKTIQEPQFSYPSNSHMGSPTVSILTKAGPIPIEQNYSEFGFVKVQIPHNIHIHSQTVPTPPHLITSSSTSSLLELKPNQNPIISIVKGASFILVCLSSLALLEKATASLVLNSRMAGGILDEEWNKGMVGTLFYVDVSRETGENKKEEGIERKVRQNDRREYRTRMWVESEDPATGSASCALGAYLAQESQALEDRRIHYSYVFTQGVEMGKQSDLGVDVVLRKGLIDRVFLSGTAVKVMEGYLEI